MAREVGNSYLLTTRDANCAYGSRLGGTGGVLVALGQVPEQWRRLQWLRQPLINFGMIGDPLFGRGTTGEKQGDGGKRKSQRPQRNLTLHVENHTARLS